MRLILPLLVFLSFTARSETLYVSSYGGGTGAYSNAASAYSAASSGDTIVFPAGTNTWTNTLTISKPLTLIGSNTTIIAGTTLNDGIFYITGMTSSVPVRVTGFTFNLVNFAAYGHAINIYDSISLANLQIDHNTIHFGYEQIQVAGSKGVIHHNYFYNSCKAISFTAGDPTQADASWASMSAGTADALFVEDNHFIDDARYPANYGQEKVGTFNGGKLVIRYNEFDFDNVANLVGTATAVITHGSAAAGVPKGYWQLGTGARRGQSVVEVYNNNMHGRRLDFAFEFRGGANLVHDNILNTQTYTPRIYCYEEEQYESQWSPQRTAWPAEDQVHNTFLWNNTLMCRGVTNANYFEVAANSTNFIKEGRDYFLHAPQSTGGREYFIGANGASGSYPTDGVTYPTKGTMVFTPDGPNAYYGYVPYTYPHPLRSTPPVTITIGTTTIGTLRKL